MRTRQAPALLGQKILVTIDKWDITSRYPEGHFVRALGKVESKEAEQESLLLEFDVPYRPFGKAILDCLPPEGEQWVVPPKRDSDTIWKDREDLRQLNICSIDPPGAYLWLLVGRPYNQLLAKGCQDIDDALHARRLPNGNIEAGVRECDAFIHSIKYPNAIPLQISQMFLILFSRTTRWTSKPLRAERQYILLINV
jgi:exosome complex exonuclease DIS3/RRP44